MVASYSGLYEEGDIEHINVPPMTLPESESHIDMHGLRLPLYSPLAIKKAEVQKVGSLFMGPGSRLFSCRKKPAETGQSDGYISTRYTDKEGDNMCT